MLLLALVGRGGLCILADSHLEWARKIKTSVLKESLLQVLWLESTDFFPKLFLSLSTHNFGFQAVIEIETGYVGKGIKAIQEMYC
jgi:hypothetical protein